MPLNQSVAKLKQVTTWLPVLSYTLGSLVVFYFEFSLALKGIFLSSDWLF